MTELIEKLRAQIRRLSPRERWLIVLGLCMVGWFIVRGVWVQPLQERSKLLSVEIETLQEQSLRALRVARDLRRLQGELVQVEKLITPGKQTDLLTLLEALSTQAGLNQEQIDSVTPKPASDNPQYPERRVEVRLKGATLKQVVKLLHEIENARLYLIVRSLRITTRGKKAQILDVSFSVSSFERA